VLLAPPQAGRSVARRRAPRLVRREDAYAEQGRAQGGEKATVSNGVRDPLDDYSIEEIQEAVTAGDVVTRRNEPTVNGRRNAF
jgi:hypothetical protein